MIGLKYDMVDDIDDRANLEVQPVLIYTINYEFKHSCILRERRPLSGRN